MQDSTRADAAGPQGPHFGSAGDAGSAGGENHHETAVALEQTLETAPRATVRAHLSELADRLSRWPTGSAELLAALLERDLVAVRLVEWATNEARTEEALDWCDRLLERAPHDAGGLKLKSLLDVGLGDRSAALATADQLVAAHPDQPGSYLHRAQVRLAVITVAPEWETHGGAGTDAFESALQDCDAAIRLSPDSGQGHLTKGGVLTQLGDLDHALAVYDEALRRDPSLLGAHLERALLRLRRGEHEQAIQDTEAVLGKLSEARASDRALLAEAHLNRARARGALGDLDRASDDYAEAVRLNPGLVEAYLERGLLHNEQREYFEAKQAFEVVLRLDPENVSAYVGMGDTLLAIGENWRASSHYGSALESDPDNAAAHLGRSMAKLSLGQRARWRRRFDDMHGHYDSAVDHAEHAVRLAPDNPWAHAQLGRALRAIVAYDEAESRFDDACERVPRDAAARTVFLAEKAETLRLWGVLATDPARLQEALDALEVAAGLDAARGSHAWIQQIMGATLAELHSYRGALHAFQAATNIDPRSAWAHFGKGMLLLLLEEYEPAVAAFGQMLVLDTPGSLNGLWASTGQLLASQSWLLEAESSFADTLPALPDAHTYLDRADVFLALRAYRLAEHDQRTALRLLPDSADAAQALARSCLRREVPGGSSSHRTERLREALGLARLALEQAKTSASQSDCLELVGQAHAELGATGEAIRHLEAARELRPRNFSVRLRLHRTATKD